ncbi:N-acetyl-glucosamine-6-phosphate deacetylase [Nowakowskiella sp. JEL0407]|nr:N-acetyl-glucosamine-6-phosphate deacetylase [Nowakowskiella sp. JEL0407]
MSPKFRKRQQSSSDTISISSNIAKKKPTIISHFTPCKILFGLIVLASMVVNLYLTTLLLRNAPLTNGTSQSASGISIPFTPEKLNDTIPVWPRPQNATFGKVKVTVPPIIVFLLDENSSKSIRVNKTIERYRVLIFGGNRTKCSSDNSQIADSELKTVYIQLTGSPNNEAYGKSIMPREVETYTLKVAQENGIWFATISAKFEIGIMRAMETFSQIVSTSKNATATDPVCSKSYSIHYAPMDVYDFPRFPHRGLLVDTSRHYFPVDYLFRTIDSLSWAKMNVMHWHIVDSQSFPLESLAYKNLTLGAYSPTEIYTKGDIELIVNYGLDRGVRVIPELDMPGHARSWGVGYPSLIVCPDKQNWEQYAAQLPSGQLDLTKNETYKFVDDLISELSASFVDSYFHLGMDEVNKACYNEEPGTQSYMKEEGYKRLEDLIQFFEDFVTDAVKKKNRTPIFWEEILLEWKLRVDNQSIIQVWRSEKNVLSAVSEGYRVITSPNTYWYLDCGLGQYISGGTSWCDPFKTWQRMYTFDPLAGVDNTQLQSLIVGGEACAWSEMIDTTNLEPVLWPRTAAVAER